MTRKAITLLTGSIALAAMLVTTYQLGYSSANKSEKLQYQAIDTGNARLFHQAYYLSARPSTSPIRGYSVNLDQFEAMNRLLSDNASLDGFRIYFGTNLKNEEVTMVLGTSAGKDVTNSIFLTASQAAGLCPTLCDASSPIIITE